MSVIYSINHQLLLQLLHFGTRAYLFSPKEGSCYVFSTRNNCCEFLATDGVIFQSVTKPFFKTPVFGAPLIFFKGLEIHACFSKMIQDDLIFDTHLK